MTLRTAERISGLTIREVPYLGAAKARTYIAYGGYRDVASATGSDASKALKALVYAVYKLRCDQVRREQHHRCFCCFRLVPLETDHIRKRSTDGRDDRRENLRAMGSECHRRRHDDPLHPPEPHPKILELMAVLGLEWGGEEIGWRRVNG